MGVINLQVINWEKYNPRTDRKKSSWFRLENGIAAEPKFFGLSAAQKFVAICIFAEASKKCGAVASINVPWLADQLKIKEVEITETIQHLASTGVVVVSSGVAEVSSGCPTNERTNERTIPELENSVPLVVEIWNTKTKSPPKVKKWTKTRASKSASISIDDWSHACEKVEASEFLSGRSGKWSGATFDWLLKTENLTKVLEGNYDNRALSAVGGFTEMPA